MPIIREISTKNIKPDSISATSIVPSSISTAMYAGYVDLDEVNYYGGFKYGARKYGTTTKYSVGQAMPELDTVEI